MTSLKKLIAYNMREQRHILGISQALLAEQINTSTHYIAMIELERKTPSLSMLERIAMALQIDPPELFSMRTIPAKSIKEMQKTVLVDIEKAVNHVIDKHLKAIKNNEKDDTHHVHLNHASPRKASIRKK
jgi:transcriptional regulator with XRE-family HTH domain